MSDATLAVQHLDLDPGGVEILVDLWSDGTATCQTRRGATWSTPRVMERREVAS